MNNQHIKYEYNPPIVPPKPVITIQLCLQSLGFQRNGWKKGDLIYFNNPPGVNWPSLQRILPIPPVSKSTTNITKPNADPAQIKVYILIILVRYTVYVPLMYIQRIIQSLEYIISTIIKQIQFIMDIEEIRKRFTIFDFILWSTLICFGIIIAMIHYTEPESRKCLIYEGDSEEKDEK